MAIRAKFQVTNVEKKFDSEVVTMRAVYSDNPDHVNHSWSQWTPWGELQMSITNPSAQDQLERGQEYYLDIAKAE